MTRTIKKQDMDHSRNIKDSKSPFPPKSMLRKQVRKKTPLNTKENCSVNELYFYHAYMVGYGWVDFRLSIF